MVLPWRVASRIRDFIGGHVMPCVAVLAAAATCLAVPPDVEYASYLDFPTLGKLACMLAVVGAAREAGVFQALAWRLASRCAGLRSLVAVLVGVTGVSSMFVTNDMALLALLPLSAAALSAAGAGRLIGPVFVLQGLAANLWGMVLPFGNPQNIFLSGAFSLGLSDFLSAMMPPFALSLVVVALLCAACPGVRGKVCPVEGAPAPHPTRALVSFALFSACVAAVLGMLPVAVPLGLTLACLTALDAACPLEGVSRRWWFSRTDWGLLVTFAAFFVFSGNLSRIEAVEGLFAGMLAGGAFVPAALLSQLISNVPAAVVLARFTGDWRGLLCGVNCGGAGTPLGSLATLIVIEQFSQARPLAGGAEASQGFWKCLVLYNFLSLAALLAAGVFLGW